MTKILTCFLLCIETEGDLKEGDVLLTNHPVAGGSHLPDCTVITPVFQDGEIVFFTASRGHHAGEFLVRPLRAGRPCHAVLK